MSSGGKLQLAFRGPQDAYISGRPQMTFFKAIYKRYTNFAKECVWTPFDGNPRQGGKSTAIIDRQGDLIQEAFITADLDTVIDANLKSGVGANILAYAAERLIDSVEIYIGQQLIDKHYQRWWRLFSELTQNDAQKAQYSKMTSPDSAGNPKIYLPLNFFFNRNPGLALPLVSIPNQQVSIVFNWSTGEEIWTTSPTVQPASIKCWVNYIYLDDQERRMMSDREQSYLIDQVQFAGSEAVPAIAAAGPTSSVHRIPLEFKHPVKELVWCFPFDDANEKQYNYTTQAMGLCELITTGQTEPHMSGGTVRLLANTDFAETGDGPLESMYIDINRNTIAEEQGGKYFNSVQPSQCHTGCPMPGVYSYSFALNPESIKPTGTCNFSRVQEAACYLRLKNTTNSRMEMFATNFNVLDIKKGFASLAFSS